MNVVDASFHRLLFTVQKILSYSVEPMTVEQISERVLDEMEIDLKTVNRDTARKLKMRVWRLLRQLTEEGYVIRTEGLTRLKTLIHKYQLK